MKDTQVENAIKSELKRQREGLEMIPSENFASLDVLNALGSVMTNKYSEGYPGKRYYGGNEFIDVAENLAIDRAKKENARRQSFCFDQQKGHSYLFYLKNALYVAFCLTFTPMKGKLNLSTQNCNQVKMAILNKNFRL